MMRVGFLYAVLAGALGLFVALGCPAYADEGAVVVPENCWPMRGGSPSRNGASRTKPPRGRLHVGWTHEFKGPIEGEPLVWDDTVIVEVVGKPGWRELHMLDLATGKSRGRHMSLKTDRALLPSLWRRELAVRTKGSITVYRVGRRKLTRKWKREVRGVRDLQLVDGVVTYTGWGGVYRSSSGSDEPQPFGSGVASEFLQINNRPRWLSYDKGGNAAWGNGPDRIGSVLIGHHEGALPRQTATAALCGDDLFITTGLPLPLADGGHATSAWLRKDRGGKWAVSTYLTLASLPCGTREKWVAQIQNRGGAWDLVLNLPSDDATKSSLILASAKVHPELLLGAPMTMARDMLYLGNARIDLTTYELHEALPVMPRGRVVPARDCLLARTRTNVLVSLRGEADRERSDAVVKPSLEASGMKEGTLVAPDGRIKRTKLSWAGGVVNVGGKPADAKRVLLARADDGTIAYASSVRAALEGLRYLIDKEEGKAYAKLTTNAVKALDVVLAQRCLAMAERLGASKAVTKWTRRRITELAGADRGKEPKQSEVEAVLAEERALRRRTTDWIWASFEKLDAKVAWSVRAELLRAILERLPAHEHAVGAVRAAIPEGVPLPAKFDGARWLLLADAVQADPVSVALPEGPDRLAIQFARTTWRPDVIGLRSSNLLILTPRPDPARIGGCLALGELVCRTLEGLFGKPPADSPPLVLHLFESQKAYLKAAGGMGHGPPSDQAKASVGHYSPRLNISRIFLPAGEDPFEQVYSTYAHELVHHWIQARCPLPRTRGARRYDQRTPGFWLVEGIAELFAEFELDLRRREVRTQDPRAASLDTITHAPARRLIDWPTLLTINQGTFARLKVGDVVPVPMRWRVGLQRQVDQTGIFYAQAAATAQYLFHAGAATRAALIDLVRKYYEGTLTKADLQNIAGLSPKALGAKVMAYAKR